MGKIDGKIHGLTAAALAALALFLAPAARGQDDGSRAVLSNFKLPEYSKEGKLKFIVYGKKAVNLGAEIDFDDVTIDIIKDEVKSVDDVKDLQNVRIYSIDEKEDKIKEFWKGKEHSAGLLYSPKALYDKNLKTARGDKDVHLRTKMMDVDGVGFEADYDKQQIFVKKNVKVILRNNEINKDKKEKGAGEKSEKEDKVKKEPGEKQ